MTGLGRSDQRAPAAPADAPRWFGAAPELVIAIVFIIVVSLLTAGTFITYRSFSSADRSRAEVQRAHSVRSALDRVLLDIVNAETGRRGFALTEIEELLEPHNDALRRLGDDLRHVETFLDRDPAQIERLSRLKIALAARVNLIEEGVALTRTGGGGHPHQRELILRGRDLMREIRSLIAAMQQHEQNDLTVIEHQADDTANRTAITLVASNCALLAALIAVQALAYRMLRRAHLRGDAASAQRRTWIGYAVAVVGTIAATFARYLLGEVAGPEIPPYITYYIVIMLAALLGGNRAGLVATTLAAASVSYYFLPPTHSFYVARPVDQVGLALFTGINLAAALLCGALHAARERSDSEWRRAEQSSRELGELVRLLDLANLTVLDRAGRVLRWSKGAQRLLGFPAEQALGKIAHELLQTQFPKPRADMLRELESTGRWSGELQHTAADGRHVAVTSEWIWSTDSAGADVRILQADNDISELKRLEAALRRNEQRLQGMFDQAAMGIVEIDVNDRLVAVNDRLCAMLGFSQGELFEMTVHELTDPADRQDSERLHAQLHAGVRTAIDYEKRYLTRRGDPLWVHITVSGVYDRDGRWVRSIATVEDIADRKRAEHALQQAQQELAAANAALERKVLERTRRLQETVGELEHFSYTITHDMRAPLRAMRGFADIVVADNHDHLKAGTRDLLNRIAGAAARMDRLISDSLNYAKIVSRGFELKPVDVGKLLAELVATYPNLNAENITIVGPVPCVLGNDAGLTQSFTNLISNGLKFARPGVTPNVTIRAERRGERVRIWCEDNGIGIPAEFHDRIWDLFQRLSPAYEGTGVGLALVRKSVERMGGTVGVESTSVGSRFWIELQSCAEPLS